MSKIIGNTTATPMAIPDWNQTNPAKADYIKNKPDIQGLIDKVGDESVAKQINDAIGAIKPKITTITLTAASWSGNANPWSQAVHVDGATVNSKVDLQPTAIQVVELQNNDIALMTENDNGRIVVYALGSKPEVDYTIQALITEVSIV